MMTDVIPVLLNATLPMLCRELLAANDIDTKEKHPSKAADSRGSSGRSSGIGIGSIRGGV